MPLPLLDLNRFGLLAKFKNRTPDPGVCHVMRIDWDNQTISMSNGALRYCPSFDEVEVWPRRRAMKEVCGHADD